MERLSSGGDRSSSDSEAAVCTGGDGIGDSNTNTNTNTSVHVIDIKSDERICRICHLNAKESGKNWKELIELGCGCKGELGFAHLHCGEAWFRLKGNRLCEICSETAKNISGVSDVGFMEEWSESRPEETVAAASAGGGSRRWLSRQPFCNFLMSCLVIAFVLPLFFRVNML